MTRIATAPLVIICLALILHSFTSYADVPIDSVLYTPPALQVTDPELQK